MLKIGFHTGAGGNPTGIGDYFKRLDDAKRPAVLASTDHYGMCFELAELANKSGVDHRIRFRLSTMGQNDGTQYDVPQYDLPPIDAARIHWQATRAKLPPEFDKRVWLEPINEVDKKRADWLGYFAVEISKLALDQGYRLALYGWSSGEPEPEHWETPGQLAYLRLCSEHPDNLAIGLHEYSYNTGDLKDGYPFKVGRFQWLFDVCDKHNIPRPKVFISEFGWTYNDLPNKDIALPEIQWAGKIYEEHPQILGAAIWYLGGGYNSIANKAQKLIAPVTEMALNWQDKDPPPPAPPPETLNKHLWQTSLKAQTISLNPNAALQQAIYKRGYVPVGSEVWTSYADKGYAVQPAEELTGKPRLAAVAEVGNWGNVWFVSNPDTDNLPVEPLSQRDSRWANKTLGQPTGHGKTIGNYGCLLVAYNMQARFLKLTGFLPDKFNQLMVEAGGFKDQYLKAGALQMAYPSQITYQDYKRRGDAGFLELIRQYLDDGLPVPCRVDFRPSTEAWEEHWVLLIGYTPDDFYMADPWTGKIGLVSEVYDITGDDLLAALFYKLKVAPVKIDLMPYVVGDGRRYYLANHDKSTQEILQSQVDGGKYYQCKNDAWESFVIDSSWIRRDKDTSPGGGRYYTQREGNLPARWLPRNMEVGQQFSISLRVQFYTLADCQPSAPNSGDVTDSRQLVAHYSQWTSRHGVTLNDVVEVLWINGGERYFYARGFGLVGWERMHQDPNTPQWTAISELVQGGNNARMSGCFGT